MDDFRFVKEGHSANEDLNLNYRDAAIENAKGEIIFELKEVEAPVFWSDTAVNIAASKYFNKEETSVFDMVTRVTDRIATWGREQGYFSSISEEDAWNEELRYILLNQYAIFNSPVFFNLGNGRNEQISACFILDVEDDMNSILDWYKEEGLIFKEGSGTGVNLSKLRASIEPLSGGGIASGPLSFMIAADALAGVIKAGGTNRRAAKLVILDADHLDIEAFIDSKMLEERKAKRLIANGFSNGIEGEAYSAVHFQNTNHSVRFTDAFMEAVKKDDWWMLKSRKTSPKFMDTEVRARDLFRKIAQAAWECGDPGLQFHDNVNKWNTLKNDGEIVATNPCGELTALNNTSCNLASLNLVKFYDFKKMKFNIEAFRHTIDVMITAQDIMVAKGDYPTEKIKENSIKYRPLGLGYANLGGLLMRMGYPYDSDTGRGIASIITALMTGQAYLTSHKLAEKLGSFEAYENNKRAVKEVLGRHDDAIQSQIVKANVDGIWAEAVYFQDEIKTIKDIWNDLRIAPPSLRNSQVTLLAPTGTTGLVMDCDTMGIEPEFSLIKYKSMAGGGVIKTISKCAEDAIRKVYVPECQGMILEHLKEHGGIEGRFDIITGDPALFDTALPNKPGGRCISPEGHIKMMMAVQPFLSGAISKTVNIPRDYTPEQIEQIYMAAWEGGLKGVTVFRDGCKAWQPMTTTMKSEEKEVQCVPTRNRLPRNCEAVRHKFRIGELAGYLHVGKYDDGKPGEVFITISKEGSTIAGLMDTLATITSMALQYGVPLSSLVDKFSHVRFEPSGMTSNDDIPIASSIVDYVFRYLGSQFLTKGEQRDIGLKTNGDSVPYPPKEGQITGVLCSNCGSIMIRSGSCYSCGSCGSTTGCS
jgi:ribonucleoside-diphosphate reductase alpha chain